METAEAYVDLNSGQYSLLQHLKENAQRVEGTLATVFRQSNIAADLNRTPRTVYRQIDDLEEKGYIERSAKRGGIDGGTVVTFNTEKVYFESHPDNPITGKTKKAEEIRDKVFPNKGTYIKDTRSPQQKARDAILKKRMTDENARVNLELSQLAYPTKELFEMTENPEENYRAYLLSRLYNVVLISSFESMKEQAIQHEDEKGIEIYSKYCGKYYNYDVLKKEFMGTRAFTDFKKLDKLLQEKDWNPFDYLTKCFQTMIYLAANGKNARPPFTNTLFSEDSQAYYLRAVDWKLGFEDKHFYYEDTVSSVRKSVKRYPIISIILTAYKNPMQKIYDVEAEIKDYVSRPDTHSPKLDVLAQYYVEIMAELDESDLEEDVIKATKTYVTQSLYPQFKEPTPNEHLMTKFYQTRNNVYAKGEPEGTQGYYIMQGNYTNEKIETLEQAHNYYKRGKDFMFSLEGGRTFDAVFKTIRHVGQVGQPLGKVREGMKYLEGLVPIDSTGEIDIYKIYKQRLPEDYYEGTNPMNKIFTEVLAEEAKYHRESQLEEIRRDKTFDIEAVDTL